jgi:hypothetical protein
VLNLEDRLRTALRLEVGELQPSCGIQVEGRAAFALVSLRSLAAALAYALGEPDECPEDNPSFASLSSSLRDMETYITELYS